MGAVCLKKKLSNPLLVVKGDQESKAVIKSHNLSSNSLLTSKDNLLHRASQPLRLLKEFDAPVIYVKDWNTDLQDIIRREAAMSSADRTARRQALLQWYASFLAKMQHRLVSVLEEKFFHQSPV